MRLRFTVSLKPGFTASLSTYAYEFDKDEILVGRDQSVDIRLPHQAISLVHCRIFQKKQEISIVDNASTNGTKINGKRIMPHCPIPIELGSRIGLGPFEIVLSAPLKSPMTYPADTAAFARQMVLEILGVMENQSQVYFEIKRGPQQGERWAITSFAKPLIIGRGENCDFRLIDADVSRRHLELYREGERYWLRDLESKNGFQINGQRWTGNYPLQPGDKVQIGQTILVFNNAVEQYFQALQLAGDADESITEQPLAMNKGEEPAEGISPPSRSAIDDEKSLLHLQRHSVSAKAFSKRREAGWWILIVIASSLIIGSLIALGYLLF